MDPMAITLGRCQLCKEWMDSDETEPRLLQCGHSFCMKCVFTEPLWVKCPQCNYHLQDISQPNTVPVNYALKDLSSILRNKSNFDDCHLQNSCITNTFCMLHHLPNQYKCISCKSEIICGFCSAMRHKLCNELEYVGPIGMAEFIEIFSNWTLKSRVYIKKPVDGGNEIFKYAKVTYKSGNIGMENYVNKTPRGKFLAIPRTESLILLMNQIRN